MVTPAPRLEYTEAALEGARRDGAALLALPHGGDAEEETEDEDGWTALVARHARCGTAQRVVMPPAQGQRQSVTPSLSLATAGLARQ